MNDPQDVFHLKWSNSKTSYSGCELTLESNNNFPLTKDKSGTDHQLRMSLGPDQLAFSEFVKEGWRRESQFTDLHVPNEWFQRTSDAIFWSPSPSLINDADENDKCFYLDGESIGMQQT